MMGNGPVIKPITSAVPANGSPTGRSLFSAARLYWVCSWAYYLEERKPCAFGKRMEEPLNFCPLEQPRLVSDPTSGPAERKRIVSPNNPRSGHATGGLATRGHEPLRAALLLTAAGMGGAVHAVRMAEVAAKGKSLRAERAIPGRSARQLDWGQDQNGQA